MCPINWITCYLLKVHLASGFFFWASDRSRDISPRPFIGSAVNSRLRGYLTEAKLHDGETPHSFRAGLSTTLRLLGCSQQQVAQYIGWKSGEMAQHYSCSSDAAGSLTILEVVFPSATRLVTVSVSHPAICNPFVPIEQFSLSSVIVTPSPPIRVEGDFLSNGRG